MSVARAGSPIAHADPTLRGCLIAPDGSFSAEPSASPRGTDVLPTSEELGTLHCLIEKHISSQHVEQHEDQPDDLEDLIFENLDDHFHRKG